MFAQSLVLRLELRQLDCHRLPTTLFVIGTLLGLRPTTLFVIGALLGLRTTTLFVISTLIGLLPTTF